MTFHPLWYPRRDSANVPPIVKHVVRFCRRLRDHRIYSYDVLRARVDVDAVHTMRVGSRLVIVDTDGSTRPSLRSVDNHAMIDLPARWSHQHRYHALWLNEAASARRRREPSFRVRMLVRLAQDVRMTTTPLP